MYRMVVTLLANIATIVVVGTVLALLSLAVPFMTAEVSFLFSCLRAPALPAIFVLALMASAARAGFRDVNASVNYLPNVSNFSYAPSYFSETALMLWVSFCCFFLAAIGITYIVFR